MTPPRRVHMLAGFAPARRKVRAVCTCGWITTPRVDEARARDARDEHANSFFVCARCGRDRDDWNLSVREQYDHLQLLVDGAPMSLDAVLAAVLAIGHDDERWGAWRDRDQVLVCRDGLEECDRRAATRARLAELDPAGRPQLRVIPGGGAR